MTTHKPFKMPSALHAAAVELSPRVLAQWPERAPPNYRKGGPGAAVHAGISMLRSVMDGNQSILQTADLDQLKADLKTACDVAEAAQAAADTAEAAANFERERAAVFSILTLCACQQVAVLNGDSDPESRGSAIAAELIRAFVATDTMEREAEAETEREATALRSIAATLLIEADSLGSRAAAVRERVQ